MLGLFNIDLGGGGGGGQNSYILQKVVVVIGAVSVKVRTFLFHWSLEKCFISIIWRNYVDSMETVLRVILFWRFYGKINMEIVL